MKFNIYARCLLWQNSSIYNQIKESDLHLNWQLNCSQCLHDNFWHQTAFILNLQETVRLLSGIKLQLTLQLYLPSADSKTWPLNCCFHCKMSKLNVKTKCGKQISPSVGQRNTDSEKLYGGIVRFCLWSASGGINRAAQEVNRWLCASSIGTQVWISDESLFCYWCTLELNTEHKSEEPWTVLVIEDLVCLLAYKHREMSLFSYSSIVSIAGIVL